MSIETFNRIEKKFLLREESALRIEKAISGHMILDPHSRAQGFYTVASIYYDTQEDYLIRRSLAGPAYKEKLRLRSYGVPKPDGKAYLEIKKKFRGRVSKRRLSLGLSDGYRILREGGFALEEGQRGTQISREIDHFLSRYRPVPKVYIAYDRRAYAANDDLRVTFDWNIRSRRSDLFLEAGDAGELLVDSACVLMEVKFERTLPLWFARLMTEQGLISGSFSKYGTEFLKQRQKHRMTKNPEEPVLEGLEPCLTVL